MLQSFGFTSYRYIAFPCPIIDRTFKQSTFLWENKLFSLWLVLIYVNIFRYHLHLTFWVITKYSPISRLISFFLCLIKNFKLLFYISPFTYIRAWFIFFFNNQIGILGFIQCILKFIFLTFIYFLYNSLFIFERLNLIIILILFIYIWLMNSEFLLRKKNLLLNFFTT
jgi:hypothetical protein